MPRYLDEHALTNSVGSFIGDETGAGHGWLVAMPDGSRQKVYVIFPSEPGLESRLVPPDTPKEHDGLPITDTPIANLGGLYLAALARMVEEFTARFSE